MARFVVGDGLDNYIKSLEELTKNITPALKMAVYAGANDIIKSIKTEINGLPTGKKHKNELTPAEVRGLHAGVGLSKMEVKNGTVNTKVGFNGYNNQKTRKFPNGEPNALVARRTVKGAAGHRKNDFVSRGVKNGEAAMQKDMEQTLNDYIEKIME